MGRRVPSCRPCSLSARPLGLAHSHAAPRDKAVFSAVSFTDAANATPALIHPMPLIFAATPSSPQILPAKPQAEPLVAMEPPWHVILHDDDQHTYEYVIAMLHAIFGYDFKHGMQLARIVDEFGRVVVATCHRELAELRVEQIESFGPDLRMPGKSQGSMRATMEPAEG